MNFSRLFHYAEALASAGPDVVSLVVDVMQAINDFRTGKITAERMNKVWVDFQKVFADLVGAADPAVPVATN